MIENIMKISINNETGQIMIQVPDGLGRARDVRHTYQGSSRGQS